jgi:hypothetical protein
MSLKQDRRDLVRRMARLTANREQLGKVRDSLHGRATEQLDTMPHAIKTAADHVARRKGGVLAYRYMRARLTEAARLRALALRHEDDEEADDDAG